MLDFLKERKREEKSEFVTGLLRDFRFDPVGERVVNPDPLHFLPGERPDIAGIGTPPGICDMVGEQDSGGVEFEIHITGSRGGTHEEFDAAVLADHILKMFRHTADKPVANREKPVKSRIVVLQFEPRLGMVVAPFGAETRDVDRSAFFPVAGIESCGQFRRRRRTVNQISHDAQSSLS